MSTPMKLFSILSVILRWAFLGEEGDDSAYDASGSTQTGKGFSEIGPGSPVLVPIRRLP